MQMIYYIAHSLALDTIIVPVITLIENISRALDTSKIVCGIFIDFRKAFDVILHKTLLKKLYAYGISGEIDNWFKSYLSDRSQFVH